jgi:probable F420-dependent oxidoreductase
MSQGTSDSISSAPRWGLTVPAPGLSIAANTELFRQLPEWGYSEVWTAEVAGPDAFTPLAFAAGVEPRLQLGTAIVPVFTRGPALIAQSAAAMASAAPGRFRLGLGASSPAIVESWNGLAFDQPFRRTRDVLRFVQQALSGAKVTGTFDTFRSDGFRLEAAPEQPVPILLAALRPQMLALAGREADGVILNWLAPHDVAQCLQAVGNPASEVVARIFVCPTEDADYARKVGRRMIATYLTVRAYAEFHRWLGRSAQLERLWTLWEQGDRAGAAAAVPEEVIDELLVHGGTEQCRDRVQQYAAAGVQVPVLAVVPTPEMSDPAALAGILAGLGRPGIASSTTSSTTGVHR